MNLEVREYVRRALSEGVGRDEVRQSLATAGWPESEIRRGLAAFADIPGRIPVPRPKASLDAREAFLYAVQFFALYMTVYHLGATAFYFIDRACPEALTGSAPMYPHADQTLRWAIASMVISFPIFLVTYFVTNRAIERDPTKRVSRPRRVLTYLTLFVAVVCGAGDLIELVYGVLGGELTIRFGLKVATVAGLAGGVLGFFLWDLRQDEVEP